MTNSFVIQKELSSTAVAVLGQLFLLGPSWDGNVMSKSGRNELANLGLVDRIDGWNFLTREGVSLAVSWQNVPMLWKAKQGGKRCR